MIGSVEFRLRFYPNRYAFFVKLGFSTQHSTHKLGCSNVLSTCAYSYLYTLDRAGVKSLKIQRKINY